MADNPKMITKITAYIISEISGWMSNELVSSLINFFVNSIPDIIKINSALQVTVYHK